jgi:hypothetical protein
MRVSIVGGSAEKGDGELHGLCEQADDKADAVLLGSYGMRAKILDTRANA